MQYSQEHLKTMVYAEFGGQTECIMGNWKIENGDGTSILHCHPSHAKVQPPAGQREYLHFSVILRP